MCLIVYKPAGKVVPEEILRSAVVRNHDGFGIMAYVDKRVITIKSPNSNFNYILKKWNEFKDYDAALHLRMATSGEVNLKNTHPFRLTLADGHSLWIMHNGILSGATVPITQKKNSDTFHLVSDFLKFFYERDPSLVTHDIFLHVLSEFIGGGNKLVLLDENGQFYIINQNTGKEHESGCWLSNSYAYTDPKEAYWSTSCNFRGNHSRWVDGKWVDVVNTSSDSSNTKSLPVPSLPLDKEESFVYYTADAKKVHLKKKR